MSDQCCIAIVDDDESVREATISLFKSMGFSAMAFASAEAFLESGVVERTSCLVTDVQMPGMDGIGLHSHLSQAGRRIPTVVGPRRPGDPPVLVAASDKSRRELGWKPTRDRLEMMVESAWRWMQR